MLKRYQVLLPDWLEDYIKNLVDKYDLSFSEVIRVELCFSILSSVTNLHPEFKPSIAPKDILELVRNNAQNTMTREEIHRLLSKIYFETRKSVEYRLGREKKQKKK